VAKPLNRMKSIEEPMTSIDFIAEGEKKPFSEFLIAQKIDSNMSWGELSKLCGVNRINAYASNTTNGAPNRPTKDKFKKIITALGFDEDDFQTEFSRKSNSSQYSYEDGLKILGDTLVLRNSDKKAKEQLLSTTAIRTILDETFYGRYAKSHEDRERILDDLHSMNPDYRSIKLQRQVQNRANTHGLRVLPDGSNEEDLIIDAIFNFSDDIKDRVPFGLYKHVHEELNTKLEQFGLDRSKPSVTYHIRKIIDGEVCKKYTLENGSPKPSGCLDDILQKELDEHNLVDTSERVTTLYLHYGPEHHKALVVYLMDQDNVRDMLGNAKLVGVKLNENEVPLELKETYMENQADKDFPDTWLSCDLIYRRDSGKYVVAAIKERAVDTEHKNATIARQQVAAAVGVAEDDIQHLNWEANQTLYDRVDGVVAAYEISPDLKGYFDSKPGRDAYEVSFTDVQKYIRKRLGDDCP